MTQSELSPQQQLDADTAEYVRLTARAEDTHNPLMRAALSLRARYIGFLIGEDTAIVEAEEYAAQHPTQTA